MVEFKIIPLPDPGMASYSTFLGDFVISFLTKGLILINYLNVTEPHAGVKSLVQYLTS